MHVNIAFKAKKPPDLKLFLKRQRINLENFHYL